MTQMPPDMQAVVDGLRRKVDATERLGAELADLRRLVGMVNITESAAGGAVRVTVGENGSLTDVSMTDGIKKLSPDQVAGAVMTALRKAQAEYPRRLAEIMAASVDDERVTDYIVGAAEKRFPPVPDEPEPHTAPTLTRWRAPEQPTERPARRRAAGRADVDDDFGDEPILRGALTERRDDA
ncbi:YbaB/EbfC DNA-binding family protein [Herbihabitans rhizosphaerae]|uniref:YbaB/EbfC DNA-binding family protein n=1 Tax=Herbihabitans rhizosphaerae TaxID=1872711 RepID=A0A4Q7KL72_9PSEU|nr:YbaB/EbfC family nucleoid-associated protein [Herbihabitans rhizosphaerae]RZS36987.1 YbaB/EbfC DNA-binding family protein [Herbihabitans rhizosphaerae]